MEIYNAVTGACQSGISPIHSYFSPTSSPVDNESGNPINRDDRSDRIGGIVVWILLGVLFVLPLPGTLLNWLLGRFANDPNGLFTASRGDGWTWLISIGFWLAIALIFIGTVRGWFRVKASQPHDSTLPNDNHFPPHPDEETTSIDNDHSQQQEASPPPSDDDFESLCTDVACAEVLELDLSTEVTMDEVRTAYRQKIASYHPDKVAHLGPKLREVAELESKRLNVAYQYFEDRYGHAA